MMTMMQDRRDEIVATYLDHHRWEAAATCWNCAYYYSYYSWHWHDHVYHCRHSKFYWYYYACYFYCCCFVIWWWAIDVDDVLLTTTHLTDSPPPSPSPPRLITVSLSLAIVFGSLRVARKRLSFVLFWMCVDSIYSMI